MRIVVIGGSGNAGSAIVRALARRGADVHPMSRSGKAIAGASGVKADIVSGDGLDEALAGAEVIVDAVNSRNPIDLKPFTIGARNVVAAAERGRRVYYGTLADLIMSLEEAEASGLLQQRLKVLTYPALLVVDEIGYLPVRPGGATLFFQLMARRYERGSTVLTSNKGFEEWGGVFGDEVMAAALIDRVLHHCHIVSIRGNSYRIRHHRDLWSGEAETSASSSTPALATSH